MTIVKSAQGTTKIKSIILSWIIVWVTNFQNKVLHLIRHLMKFRIRITFCINDRRVREREKRKGGSQSTQNDLWIIEVNLYKWAALI